MEAMLGQAVPEPSDYTHSVHIPSEIMETIYAMNAAANHKDSSRTMGNVSLAGAQVLHFGSSGQIGFAFKVQLE